MDMVPVYSPLSESEAAVISSLMRAYDIPFFLRGGAFSSMYPGSFSNSLNEQMLMVRPQDVALAKQLLEPFISDQETSS